MRLTETQLRRAIRRVLHEGFDDIRAIEVRMRIKVSKPTDPTVSDVLTDVRGVPNVITVTQLGPMGPAPDGKNWIELEVGFVDDDEYDVPDLIRDIRAISGVDMVRIRELDPEGNVVSR